MVSRTRRLPLYAEIRQSLEQEITKRKLAPGDKLPPEDELAARYGASRLTVRRAIDQLVDQGKLERMHGQGTFVAQQPTPKVAGVTRWSFELFPLGERTTKRVTCVKEVSPTLRVANLLNTLITEQLIELTIHISVDDAPLGYTVARIPKAFVANVTTWDVGNAGLAAFLRRSCGLEFGTVSERVRAVPAEEDAAEILGVEPGSALLYVDSLILLTSGIPAIAADTFVVGSKYDYKGLLKPFHPDKAA